MITRLRFTVSLLRMMAKFDKGDYLSSYRIADQMTNRFCPKNARILLFKAYLLVLLEYEDQAKVDLRAFYEVVESDGKALGGSGDGHDDGKWICAFANYLRLVLAMGNEVTLANGHSAWNSMIDSIDFSRVSELSKRMFPPQHIPDMRQYM